MKTMTRRPEPGPGAAPATITARLLTSAIPVVIGAVSAYGVWRFGPGEYRIIGVALLVTFVTYGAEDWWTPKTTRTARLLRILIESVTTVCLVIVGYAVGAMVDHPENQHTNRLGVGFAVAVVFFLVLRAGARAQETRLDRHELTTEITQKTRAWLEQDLHDRSRSAHEQPHEASEQRRSVAPVLAAGFLAGAVLALVATSFRTSSQNGRDF